MRACAAVCVFLFANAAFAIDSAPAFENPALQTRYEHLTHELRCLVCQNETIADSTAPLAADLRREVHNMLQAGKSDAQVLRFLTDRYGDFILYRPPFNPRTWLLWAAPVLLVIIGLITAILIIRQRARLAALNPEELTSDGA